jgi:hypothetical protein
MKHSLFKLVACLALVPGGARAQVASAGASTFGVQNFDISIFCSEHSVKPQALDGVTIYSDTDLGCFSEVIGYQVAHPSAASLWIELAPDYHAGGVSYANIPGSVSRGMSAHTLGVRFMAPLQPRISVYGALGGGAAGFYEPAILAGSTPVLLNHRTTNGVFDFGGGVDVRLSRRFSIRSEVRDFVTAQGLSGVSGHNHVLPLFGVTFHF